MGLATGRHNIVMARLKKDEVKHDGDICIVLDKIVMENIHNLEGLRDPIASLSLEKVGATITSTGELGLVSIVGPAVTLVKIFVFENQVILCCLIDLRWN